MSQELPEDVREWPSDPFELLGIARGADETTIRRAYTQLIRRFKPERFPEQFRKIREAYEECQTQYRWYLPNDFVAQLPSDLATLTEPTPPAEPLASWSQPRVNHESSQTEQFWQRAIEGNLVEAYAGFLTMANNHDESVAAFRLYWLLSLDPSLDANRTRHHWLCQALTQSRFDDRSLELYRRELAIDPAASLAEPYHTLLEQDMPWTQLVGLARSRIAAAARVGRYSQVKYDLKLVANRRGVDGDAEWLGLLVTAYDWTIWDQPLLLGAYLADETAALKHLELQHSHAFDRIEQVRYLNGDPQRVMPPSLNAFLRLLRNLWANYRQVTRAELIAGLVQLADQPSNFLFVLDGFFAERGAALGMAAADMIAPHVRGWEHSISPNVLRGYIRQFLDRNASAYHRLRMQLLGTLSRDWIDPADLAEAGSEDRTSNVRHFASQLQQDNSLRIIWFALVLCGRTVGSG